jgi:hypothetical protein
VCVLACFQLRTSRSRALSQNYVVRHHNDDDLNIVLF